MAGARVRFELGQHEWMAEREGVLFLDHTDLEPVEFLITADALIELLNPELNRIDSETAVETFVEFEADIHRVARREFVSRLGGEPPILLSASDLVA